MKSEAVRANRAVVNLVGITLVVMLLGGCLGGDPDLGATQDEESGGHVYVEKSGSFHQKKAQLQHALCIEAAGEPVCHAWVDGQFSTQDHYLYVFPNKGDGAYFTLEWGSQVSVHEELEMQIVAVAGCEGTGSGAECEQQQRLAEVQGSSPLNWIVEEGSLGDYDHYAMKILYPREPGDPGVGVMINVALTLKASYA